MGYGKGSNAYTSYVATLSQAGTAAPAATVRQNSLGGTIVWTRTGAGDYEGTLAGAFPAARLWLSHSFNKPGNTGTEAFVHFFRTDDNTLSLKIFTDDFGGFTDDWDELAVEVRIY